MASLDDQLTTAQNLVRALNSAATTYLNVNGATAKAAISTPTLVWNGAGRLAVVSVTSAGAVGMAYDSASTSDLTAPICVIPASAGVFGANVPVSRGIVVVPGAGQVVTVTYSATGT